MSKLSPATPSNEPSQTKRTNKAHLESKGAKVFKAKLDEIMDTDKLALYLYLDRKLTKEEFDAKVIELGYRAALRTLAAEAQRGDTKALDLFLKRADAYFSRPSSKVVASGQASPSYKPRRSASLEQDNDGQVKGASPGKKPGDPA